MPELFPSPERASLLADVAEMYYLEEKGQAEIARAVGVTRSMISRMLKEAREKGIVEVRINRPLRSEHELQTSLTVRFDLVGAFVVPTPRAADGLTLDRLGEAAAHIVRRNLKPGTVLGLSWGTSVSAVVDALQVDEPIPVKIVQLVGALGARNTEYDGHALVTRLAEKIGGEAYYLNAPFLCPNPETAETLMETPGVRESIELGRIAQVAVLGIGSTAPQISSYFLAGYVPIEELAQLNRDGAVGDVAGVHYDIHGKDVCGTFCKCLVTVAREDLLNIPLRLGIAGGLGKAETILGALRGGYINFLVTDSDTARHVLDLDAGK